MFSLVVVLVSSLQLLSVFGRFSGFSVPIRRVPRLRYPLYMGNVLTTDVSITNRNEFAYLVSVSVGGQEFSVILDTGSSDFWIASSECTNPDCSGTATYTVNKSSSLSLSDKEFKLSYLMGSVAGNVAFETVRLGSFEVVSQVFALANITQGLGLSSTGTSGILGLAFPSTASIPLVVGNPLLENILSNFDESNRFFAFKLGRGSGPNDDTSSFTIGELDQNITSEWTDFTFIPVSKAGADSFNYWKLPLQSLIIDNVFFPLSPSLVAGSAAQVAVLDTGTTLILGPNRDVEAFWKVIDQGGATRKNDVTGLWEVRCDRGISVSFLLGDKATQRAFPIDPSDMNWEEGGSRDGWCMGGMQSNDGVNSGDWLLGDVFLRNVYVTHHAANSTHQPFIGLLNVTDPLQSLSQFRTDRGPEQSHLATHGTRPNTLKATSPVFVYVISSICGFVVGGAVTLFIRIRRGHSLTY